MEPSRTPPSSTRVRALLRTARAAVADAAASVTRRAPIGRPVRAQRKGEGDFVTAVDIATERRLRRAILAAHPEHGFVGEETTAHAPEAEFVWVVDPIDGTSNYARGLPHYGIAAACLWRGWPVAAAVHCMPEDALYSAARDLGAFCGRKRLALQRGRTDDGAIIGAQWFRETRDLGFLRRAVASGARIRTLGSTVVQLCDVAAGRLDANVQQQGRAWDFVAAALIVTEAGGKITGWGGEPLFPILDPGAVRHYPTLAAAPNVHRRLRRLLAP